MITYVVVVDDAAALVGVHTLESDEPYSSVEGAHGKVVFETADYKSAVAVFDAYINLDYRRDGGIVAPPKES